MNIPGSYNEPQSVEAFYDEPQILTFMIHSVAANRGREWPLTLEFVLPEGTHIYGFESLFSGEFEVPVTERDGVAVGTVSFVLKPVLLLELGGAHGEWQNVFLTVKFPQPADPAQPQSVAVRLLSEGVQLGEYRWPLELSAFAGGGVQSQRIRLGLWDYGYNRTTFAGDELADFFARCGINYNTSAIANRAGEVNRKLQYGGQAHHSHFDNPQYRDLLPSLQDGEDVEAGYASAQAIIDHGAGIIARGIEVLDMTAATESGIGMIDFEPSGYSGFAPGSVERFCREYGIDCAAFARFADEYAKRKYEMFQIDDPELAEIFRQWGKFRSAQDQEVVGIIARALKACNPAYRFEISSRSSVGENDISSYAMGHNNAAMMKHLDGIMPQIYHGYDGTAVKQCAATMRLWAEERQRLNPDCRIYPVILVRYAVTAPLFNTLAYTRLQTLTMIAEGADGVVWYYPQNMNAPYYNMIAGLSAELAPLEDFYLDGERVDELFAFADLPHGEEKVTVWPGYEVTVKDPAYHYTAHRLGDEILLTLFNYREIPLDFNFNRVPEGVTGLAGTITVAPLDVKFIVLKLR